VASNIEGVVVVVVGGGEGWAGVQVWLEAPAPGRYTVLVRGYHVPAGPQCFAVAVAGDFAPDPAPPAAPPPCPTRPGGGGTCAGHGECGAGDLAVACVCEGLWAGFDCSRPVTELQTGAAVTRTVAPNGWDVYAFDLGPYAGGWFEVTMTRTSRAGDPDLFLRVGGVPDLLHASTVCACADGMDPGACA
jgi:hypothetical protein